MSIFQIPRIFHTNFLLHGELPCNNRYKMNQHRSSVNKYKFRQFLRLIRSTPLYIQAFFLYKKGMFYVQELLTFLGIYRIVIILIPLFSSRVPSEDIFIFANTTYIKWKFFMVVLWNRYIYWEIFWNVSYTAFFKTGTWQRSIARLKCRIGMVKRDMLGLRIWSLCSSQF